MAAKAAREKHPRRPEAIAGPAFLVYNSFVTPSPSQRQQAICDRLAGLPFVGLTESVQAAQRFVCHLSNGEKARAVELEEIFNAGLIVEAMEGPGSAARQTMANDAATRFHHELVAQAEKAFGITIQDALPIYLAMPRHTYGRWEDRPRVKWPKPQAN